MNTCDTKYVRGGMHGEYIVDDHVEHDIMEKEELDMKIYECRWCGVRIDKSFSTK